MKTDFKTPGMALVVALLATAPAYSAYNIGGGSSGNALLDMFSAMMQTFVNFATGPYALFVSLMSVFAGIGLWMVAPKMNGIAAIAARVAVGSIAMLNVATWFAMFKFG